MLGLLGSWRENVFKYVSASVKAWTFSCFTISCAGGGSRVRSKTSRKKQPMEDAESELQEMKEEKKRLKLRIEERKRKLRDLQKEKEDEKAKKIHWAFGKGLMDWLLRRREELLFLSTFVWQVINGVYFKLLGGLRWLRKSHRGKQRNGVGCSYYFSLPFMSALCKLTHLLVESWYVYLISWSNSSVSLCVCVCWYVSIVCVVSCLLRENMTANMDVNFLLFLRGWPWKTVDFLAFIYVHQRKG